MGRSARALLLLVAAAAAPLACSGNGANDTSDAASDAFVADICKTHPTVPGEAKAVIGQGQNRYADLPDGTTLTWEKGPQGGHHVWIALRMFELQRSGTIVTLDMTDTDTSTLINHTRVIYPMDPDAPAGWCTLSGLRMQLDNAGGEPLATVLNHHVRLDLTVQDRLAGNATATKTIIVTGILD